MILTVKVGDIKYKTNIASLQSCIDKSKPLYKQNEKTKQIIDALGYEFCTYLLKSLE